MSSTITSSSSYSVGTSSYSNKGFSGLTSGIDEDSLVEKLLSGTQTKIDKQNQAKQVLEWKQDMYRDVISSVNTFQSTYFDTSFDSTLSTNLISTNFFNSMASKVASGSSVSVISSSADAAVGDMAINVTQLATAASITSTNKLSGNSEISGTIPTNLSAFQAKNLVLNVKDSSGNTNSVKIDLSDVNGKDSLVSTLNASLQSYGVSAKITTNGTLSLTTGSSASSVSVDSASTSAALTMSGLAASASSKQANTSLNAQTLYAATAPNMDVGCYFTVNLNGVSKQLNLSPKLSGSETALSQNDIKAALAKSISDAYGGTVDSSNNVTGGYVNLSFDSTDSSKFTLTPSDTSSSQLTITGMYANDIGITPGASSRISTDSTLSTLTKGTAGDVYKFKINGHDFTFSGTDKLYNVIDTINNSGAGVKLSYSSLSDTAKLEATSTGANYGVTMSQSEGNLLTTLFGSGVAAGSTAAGNEIGTSTIAGSSSGATTGTMNSAILNLNVNGTNYSLTVAAKTDKTAYSMTDLLKGMNAELQLKFHDTSGKATIQIDNSGNLNITDGSIVKFSQSSIMANNTSAVASAYASDLGYRLGYTVSGKSNVATASTTVSALGDSSLQSALTAAGASSSDTLSAAAANIGLGFDSTNNRFTITQNSSNNAVSTFSSSHPALYSKLFSGVTDANLSTGTAVSTITSSSGNGLTFTKGADAVADVTINGTKTTLTRSSNDFAVNGVNLQLTATGESTIGTTRDSDSIVKAVKQFVTDYNTMVKTLHSYVDADPTYRDYSPLTDSQKSQMKDTEITEWTKKAQTGLLRNDDDIENFLSQMRSAVYQKPASSNYGLYDIGIETESYSDDPDQLGTLTFDETAFRKALSTDPQSVITLFTDSESGVARQMNNICNDTAKISMGSPGSLVQLAGVANKSWSNKNNTIYGQITDINDRITDLKSQYEDQRTRYWKQFNNMDSILSSYNTQSSWLSQQFSS